MVDKKLYLRAGREKSVLAKHPWIFASAIDNVEGNPESGETVMVCDSHKKPLAWAAFSPSSQIRVRVWTTSIENQIDKEYFQQMIEKSIARRKSLLNSQKTNAVRLIYGESDQMPGLIVDQYNRSLVIQILSAGPERFREDIVDILEELIHPDCIYERSDVEVRLLEGLPERQGLLRGKAEAVSQIIVEHGVQYYVNLDDGQKTGFYIDQRENRQALFSLAKDKDVLNCFCYTGGFSLNALAGGAKSVISVDSSEIALEKLQKNLLLNQLDSGKHESIEGDVFKLLRLFRDQARTFDLIILDPPKFAPTISQAEKAARAYKDINLLAIKMLRPRGKLLTFSCSGGISRDLFQKIVAGAALDAAVDLRITDFLSQSSDHPVLMSFPESFYLKGLICEK